MSSSNPNIDGVTASFEIPLTSVAATSSSYFPTFHYMGEKQAIRLYPSGACCNMCLAPLHASCLRLSRALEIMQDASTIGGVEGFSTDVGACCDLAAIMMCACGCAHESIKIKAAILLTCGAGRQQACIRTMAACRSRQTWAGPSSILQQHPTP